MHTHTHQTHTHAPPFPCAPAACEAYLLLYTVDVTAPEVKQLLEAVSRAEWTSASSPSESPLGDWEVARLRHRHDVLPSVLPQLQPYTQARRFAAGKHALVGRGGGGGALTCSKGSLAGGWVGGGGTHVQQGVGGTTKAGGCLRAHDGAEHAMAWHCPPQHAAHQYGCAFPPQPARLLC